MSLSLLVLVAWRRVESSGIGVTDSNPIKEPIEQLSTGRWLTPWRGSMVSSVAAVPMLGRALFG